MTNVYVDLDGTLLDNRLDAKFESYYKRYGRESAMAWYSKEYCDNLELNLALWVRLVSLKEEGHNLIIWTNRGERHAEMSLTNLAKWGIIDMFSGFIFGDGKKTSLPLRGGIVFDNDFRNEVTCSEFNYIPTFVI